MVILEGGQAYVLTVMQSLCFCQQPVTDSSAWIYEQACVVAITRPMGVKNCHPGRVAMTGQNHCLGLVVSTDSGH